jgi:hypothetical protein
MKALLVLALVALPGQEPSSRELQEAVEAYVALDPRTPDGRAEQLRLLELLERAPEPRESQLRTWRKRIDKLLGKQRELEPKSGEYRWWVDEGRGRFLVRGETKRPKALFIGMHGGGVGSGDAASSASSYGPAVSNLDWVGIFPEVLEKTEHGWTDSGTEEWVLDLVDAALRTWKIPPERVFLGGHSMGGYGTWLLGAHHADRWAGLAASAGAPTPYLDRAGKVVGIVEGVVPSLRNVAMVVFQSVDDPQVPPGPNQFAAGEVEAAKQRWGGYEAFDYWEVEGFGHGMPNRGAIEILEKVAEQERDPYPERVVWQPALPWKRQFYWLLWEQPRLGAIVVADLDREANAVRVEVDGDASGLSVLLSEELVDMGEPVTVRLGDEVVFEGVPRLDLATFVRTAASGDPGRTYVARVPLAGD